MTYTRLTTFIFFFHNLLTVPGFSQISVQAKAQLYFEIQRAKNLWNEGFVRCTKGTVADYESHRSEGKQERAFVIRSGDKEALMWRTAPIRLAGAIDSIRFIWSCGFGSNLAREDFRLTVNDLYEFRFSTAAEASWSSAGLQGGRLGFTAIYQNHHKALFGYMYLVLPRKGLRNGDTATIRLESLTVKKETWYRVFGYTDALNHLLKHEAKELITDVNFANLGDATIAVYSSVQRSGSTISLFSNQKHLGRSVFRTLGNLATAQFELPRDHQNTDYVFVTTGKVTDTISLKQIQEERTKTFLEEELEFEQYVFPPGHFPAPHWKRPAMVANELGLAPLNVSYFNGNMQPVTEPMEPGRYGAVVTMVLRSGFVVKRYVTLYCSAVEMDDYSSYVPVTVAEHVLLNISHRAWELYQKNVKRFSFGSLMFYPTHNADAAIFLAGLSELDTADTFYDTPRIRDKQWWITFKSKESGKAGKDNPLKKPKYINDSSDLALNQPVTPDEFYSRSALEEIRTLCRTSTDKTGEPMVTLIAHQGKIVLHEAFDTSTADARVTRETPLWMASITKLLTGVLFMQFIDQGLVDLDAPVERYLPEIITSHENKITVRHVFTHTTGLSWVGEWGSDWEPSLENRIAQAFPYVHVGGRFEYHRIGYALAGRVMESISGIAVPYLFRAYIFEPLQMKSAEADNTYGSLYCTAKDMAILAQALLQEGRYGNTELFSAGTFKKMLPFDLSIINAKLDRKWGIGTVPLSGNGLSELTYGHEAASGAILRIDPKNDLIIVSARNSVGHHRAEYERFAEKLIEISTRPFRRTK